MKLRATTNVWKVRLSASLLIVSLIGIVVKDCKFAYLICRQQLDTQFWTIVLVPLLLTAVLVMGRLEVLNITKNIHIFEKAIQTLLVLSCFLDLNGKWVVFDKLEVIGWILITFNIISVFAYPSLCNVIIDSMKQEKKKVHKPIRKLLSQNREEAKFSDVPKISRTT